MYTDSHTHLYLDAFSDDRDEMVNRAIDKGITRMFLPNIDSSSLQSMFNLTGMFPGPLLSHDGTPSHFGEGKLP